MYEILGISIVNILCIILGYIKAEMDPSSFNASLNPHEINIIALTLMVLVMQIINIKFSYISIKKNDYSKKKLYVILIFLLITYFIPVKVSCSIKYVGNYYDNNEKTIFVEEYKNIYSIPLKTEISESWGIMVF